MEKPLIHDTVSMLCRWYHHANYYVPSTKEAMNTVYDCISYKSYFLFYECNYIAGNSLLAKESSHWLIGTWMFHVELWLHLEGGIITPSQVLCEALLCNCSWWRICNTQICNNQPNEWRRWCRWWGAVNGDVWVRRRLQIRRHTTISQCILYHSINCTCCCCCLHMQDVLFKRVQIQKPQEHNDQQQIPTTNLTHFK
jgi:hypothetical protein